MEAVLEKMKTLLENILNDRKNVTAILGTSVGVVILSYMIKSYYNKRNYFKKMNLPGPTPWPILGNFVDVIRNGLIKNDMALMKKYGKTVGFFEGVSPVIMTIDTKLIRAFCIKDFGSFTNRRV